MATPDLKLPPTETSVTAPHKDWSVPLGIIGTLAGAALGVLAFWGLYVSGLYSIMLPGMLAGLGAGYPLKRKSAAMGIFAAVVGLATMLVTEWRFFPRKAGQSLVEFLTQLHQVERITLIMLVLGAFFAYWFGMGRDAKA